MLWPYAAPVTRTKAVVRVQTNLFTSVSICVNLGETRPSYADRWGAALGPIKRNPHAASRMCEPGARPNFFRAGGREPDYGRKRTGTSVLKSSFSAMIRSLCYLSFLLSARRPRSTRTTSRRNRAVKTPRSSAIRLPTYPLAISYAQSAYFFFVASFCKGNRRKMTRILRPTPSAATVQEPR